MSFGTAGMWGASQHISPIWCFCYTLQFTTYVRRSNDKGINDNDMNIEHWTWHNSMKAPSIALLCNHDYELWSTTNSAGAVLWTQADDGRSCLMQPIKKTLILTYFPISTHIHMTAMSVLVCVLLTPNRRTWTLAFGGGGAKNGTHCVKGK